MAGRIRTIKPEILEDERSAGLSSDAWRLWVSMWLLADDHGRLRGAPEWLRAQVFWSAPHPVHVSDLLLELHQANVIVQYEIAGQKYIEIRNWAKHQKVDHPGKPRIPEPCDNSSRDTRETVAKEVETLAPHTSDLRPPTNDPDHGQPSLPFGEESEARKELPGNPKKATKSLVDRWRSEASSVLEAVNAARKRVHPKSRGISTTYDSLRHIAERLEAGKSAEDCLHVVAVCEAECRANANAFQWFNAVTPFVADNFERKSASDPGMASLPPVSRFQPQEQSRPKPPPFRKPAIVGGDS